MLADVVATGALSLLFLGLLFGSVRFLLGPAIAVDGGWGFVMAATRFIGRVLWPPFVPLGGPADDRIIYSFAQISFYSAFFTSVWLWLYAASVMVSRVLIRMGGGVGFLLKVTDVEHQPFRSMGFVSVSSCR
jgi:hypothetical protein